MRITHHNGRRRVEFGPIIGTLVGIPALFLAAGLSLPYGYLKRISDKRRAGRFEERMRTANRLLTFKDFVEKLQNDEGTYIWECKSPGKGPARFWWTSDNLYDLSPFPIVDHLSISMDPGFKAFPRWCLDHYTNPRDGKASLVSMPHKYDLEEKLRNARGVEITSVRESVW